MRVLDTATKQAVQKVIDAHAADLKYISGFVSAEPGFPIIQGTIYREPAILVFVSHKKPPDHLLPEERAPRQLGPYRVAVMQADPYRQLMSQPEHGGITTAVALSSTNLTYEPMAGNPIDNSFKVASTMLCHVGPDAGWPVLKPFLEAAERTLSVAMYDFNADYVAKTFIDSVRNNDLKVTLTWDDSMTAPETTIRKKLKTTLKESLDGWVVQCGSGRRFASAYHEKVAVRDSRAFWLSSGNWSLRSQPDIDPINDPPSAKGMYGKGNREWHVIVEDEDLAKLFESYIRHDRDGSEEESNQGDPGAALDRSEIERFPDLFVPIDQVLDAAALAATPEPVAPQTLPSLPRVVTIQPVLTPDNYIDRIIELLKSATKSIYLQYSYITYSERPEDKRFTKMLQSLADLTFQQGMDVRIIVGNNSAADKIRKLAEAGFKETAFRIQRNVHNKGIIVDGKVVLVSSANWSGDGVLRNRDAGLIIHDEEIAQYYQSVFLDDWENRANSHIDDDAPVLVASDGDEAPAGMVRMSWREYFD